MNEELLRLQVRVTSGASRTWVTMRTSFATRTEALAAMNSTIEVLNHFELERRSSTRYELRYIHDSIYEVTKTDASKMYRPAGLYATFKIVEEVGKSDGLPTIAEALAEFDKQTTQIVQESLL